MAECNHDCSNCSSKCSKESLLAPMNKASKIKHVIGVVSGKGGVGKSLVTSMLAVTMQRRGYKTAILEKFSTRFVRDIDICKKLMNAQKIKTMFFQ